MSAQDAFTLWVFPYAVAGFSLAAFATGLVIATVFAARKRNG